MKRFLLILPIFLLILLNACGVTPAMGTAVAQTQTAVVWTPTPASTHVPSDGKLVNWLNDELVGAADPLGVTLDATYRVQDIRFPPVYGTAYLMLRVDMRCECSRNMQCCTPERMFVLVMEAMMKHATNILPEVPNDVTEFKVVCYDRETQVGVMFALWSDVKGYLNGEVSGYQLGARVQRTTSP